MPLHRHNYKHCACSTLTRPAASLVPYGGLFEDDSGVIPECIIVVDVGYSFTHVVPIRDGLVLWDHVKR